MNRLPKVSGQAVISIVGDDGSEREVFVHDGDVPEEVMDAYEALVGNGMAEVTVGIDKASKEYGTGAGAIVSIRLTCNQDATTLARAASLAADFARSFAEQQRAAANIELQRQLQGGAQKTPNFSR